MNPLELNTAPAEGSFTLTIGANTFSRPTSLRERRELGAALGGSFSYFFAGHPQVYYVFEGGRYRNVDRGIAAADVIRHLGGENPSLLSIPILPDGKCCFGAIDVDRHKKEDGTVDHAALARRVTELNLPLIVCRSKSPRSAHLFAFFRETEGLAAVDARRLLEHWRRVLGIEGAYEIFPKQTELKPGQVGSGINLPYFGSKRGAFGKDGEELTLDGFLSLAWERCLYGVVLCRDLPAPNAPSPEPDGQPLPVRRIREIHAKNLDALSRMLPNTGRNNELNSVAFFAGRAFAAKALEGDEQSVKDGICRAAKAARLGDSETEATIASGWKSGLRKPLALREETEVEQVVAELNERFFVVKNFGNRCRVAWFDEENHPELKGRLKLGHQPFADFRNSLLNQRVKVGINENGESRYETKGKVWLEHADRRQYRRVVFLPEQQVAPDELNLWRGFAFEPNAGDCSLYLEHLRGVICSGNEEHFRYTLKWMALGVQRPWERGHVALVWRGDKGPGKNVAADAYAKLFGPHAMTITNSEHLVGRFNSHLRAKCVLIANEAFYAGNRQHEATLKGLITDAVLPIEQKFVDAETDVNLLHLIVLSNNDWVVPASDRERRFFMVDVSGERIGDFKYFEALHRQLEAGGYAALLDYLLHVDLTNFNVRDVPKTEALRSQMAESLTGIDAVWFECLQRGELPGDVNPKDGSAWLRGSALIEWAERTKKNDWHGLTAQGLGYLFKESPRFKNRGMGFEKRQMPLFADGERHQGWLIPPLKEARKRWNERRFEVDWDSDASRWQEIAVLIHHEGKAYRRAPLA